MRNLFFLILFGFSVWPVFLFAGDKAEFVSLGWSENYFYYSYGQYGIEDGSGFPYAEICIVNVEKNIFVENGILRDRLDSDTTNTSGLNLFLNLVNKANSLFTKYSINELKPFKILVPSIKTHRDSACIFLKDNLELNFRLVQKSKGDIHQYSSTAAFFVKISSEKIGERLVGNIKIFRQGVISYSLERVLSGPGKQYIVIVVQKKCWDLKDLLYGIWWRR